MAGYIGSALLGAAVMYAFAGNSSSSSSSSSGGGPFGTDDDAKASAAPTPSKRRKKASAGAAATPTASASIFREVSASSQQALEKLAKLEDKYDSLDARLSDHTFQEANTKSAPERAKISKRVNQLCSDLEKFLNTEVDAVATHALSSGKDESRRRRKALVSRCETLQMRADGLLGKLSRVVASPSGGKPFGGKPSPSLNKRGLSSSSSSSSPRTGISVSGNDAPAAAPFCELRRSESSQAAEAARRLNPHIGESH